MSLVKKKKVLGTFSTELKLPAPRGSPATAGFQARKTIGFANLKRASFRKRRSILLVFGSVWPLAGPLYDC
jgi:hypothetical protein